jgi:hypothetical protein
MEGITNTAVRSGCCSFRQEVMRENKKMAQPEKSKGNVTKELVQRINIHKT